MLSRITANYQRIFPANNSEKTGINRSRGNNTAQQVFMRSESAFSSARNSTSSNTLANLFSVPQENFLATRGTQRLMETRITQRIGVETYRRNNELFRQNTAQIRRTADIMRRTTPSIRSSASVFQRTQIQSGQSGLFNFSPLNITGLMQQGIRQYQFIDKPSRGTTRFLSSSADLYLKTGPKLIQEFNLFRNT